MVLSLINTTVDNSGGKKFKFRPNLNLQLFTPLPYSRYVFYLFIYLFIHIFKKGNLYSFMLVYSV